MTKPYYEDEWVTLYHGDCLEVTEWLSADVLVTDPPYGMDYTGFGGRKGEPRRAAGRLTIAGDNTVEVRDAALAQWGDRPALVFGRWNVERPAATRHRLIWDKGNSVGMGDLSIPWGHSEEEIYVLGKGFAGKRESNVIRAQMLMSSDTERPDHPTPKPVGLMELLLAKTSGVVADPFAGSGATLLAARNLGRSAIGVESEEALLRSDCVSIGTAGVQFRGSGFGWGYHLVAVLNWSRDKTIRPVRNALGIKSVPGYHVYVVRWPDGVTKAGIGSYPSRWRGYEFSGGVLLGLLSSEIRELDGVEDLLLDALAERGERAFTSAGSAAAHLYAGAGWTECYRLDDQALESFADYFNTLASEIGRNT